MMHVEPMVAVPGVQQRLRDTGVGITLQRLVIAAVMLERPVHLTAEQVLVAARQHLPEVSRATVYSTLQLFVRHGLLKELPFDGAATVFDSNTSPHHHLYHTDTGEVVDLPAGTVQVLGLPQLADGLELDEVDVIVRVRRRRDMPMAAPG